MSAYDWQHDRMTISKLSGWGGDPGALLMWATLTVDSLYYLTDLDHMYGLPQHLDDHEWQVIDLAHVRWAASSAITAVDLCAAGLARRHGIGPKTYKSGAIHEYDLAELASDADQLPQPAGEWATSTFDDANLLTLKTVRDPTIHARLPRRFSWGPGGTNRTAVDVDGVEHHVTDLVNLARVTATRIVEGFLEGIAQGQL